MDEIVYHEGYNLKKMNPAVISEMLQEAQNSVIVIGLALLLPLVGFPITVVLLSLGARFGTSIGILLAYLIIPVHLIVTFLIANVFLLNVTKRLLEKKSYHLPQIPANRYASFSFIFMVTPGLPYTVKNIMLSISGVPFPYYLVFGWLTQATMAIPFILAGEIAFNVSLKTVLSAIVIFFLGYILYLLFKQR